MVLYDLARPVLFRIDPERAHEMVVKRLESWGRNERVSRALRARYFMEDPRLSQDLWGLTFPNPVGIAAGFDKNAKLVHVLPHLGFGFVEVGTVTSEPQARIPALRTASPGSCTLRRRHTGDPRTPTPRTTGCENPGLRGTRWRSCRARPP